MTTFIQQLVNGLGIGSQYAMWAIGYGVVYQVLGIMHFAHGDTVVFATFLALAALSAGAPLVVALAVGVAGGALIAWAIERTVYSPLLVSKEPYFALVAALAAAFVLRNLVTVLWGFDTKIFRIDLLPGFRWVIGDVRIQSGTVYNLLAAVAVVVGFNLFLTRSRRGQAVQAVAEDRATAQLMGVDVGRTVGSVYALSGAIGVLGVYLALMESPTLTVGFGYIVTLKAFVAALLGGLGSIRGALFGGLVLGVAEAMIASYISTLMLNGIVFSALAVLLILRPQGLAGVRQAVRV